MNTKLFLLGYGCVLVTGCATSSLDYIPPPVKQVENQVTVNAPFDEVWERLVKNLASDFFVINNIEKNSRIINVSFSSSSPQDFVSCGLSIREFSNARGKKTYQYDPASSARYTLTDNSGAVFNAVRTAKLNGRTNIYVAPSDMGSTIISVNTKYIVEVGQSFFNLQNQSAGSQNFTFDFSTKQHQQVSDRVICAANGSLEKKILDYAR